MMKKLFTIAMFLLAGLTVSAQKGTWTTGYNEADELKGLEGGPYYLYEQEGMGSFVLWDWNDWAFKITTDNGTFDLWHNDYGLYWVNFTIGLYDKDGNLVTKFSDQLEADHIKGKTAWMNKKWVHYIYNKNKLKKMFKALKSGNGYVRIFCKRRNAEDFDLKIMPYVATSPDQKE